jgi:multicomponent Na+:H+ antiporter subunit D
MLKIWVEAFWKPHPDEPRTGPRAALGVWPFTAVAAMAALMTAAGLWPDPVLSYVGSAVSALWETTR